MLVVSGASRGFGQAVALAFSHYTCNQKIRMHAILTARSESGLQETKQLMLAAWKRGSGPGSGKDDYEPDANHVDSNGSDNLTVSIHPMDLALMDLDVLDDYFTELIEAAQPLDQYDDYIIINNAGSLGDHLGKIADMKSLEDFSKTIHLNITSSLWFTVRWTQALRSSLSMESQTTPTTTSKTKRTTIVNISSLCALQPFPTMTTYCAGKAARDMFHQSLAKEEEATNCGTDGVTHVFRTLNYAPGAMNTDMTVRLRDNENKLDPSLKTYFQQAHDRGELIDPINSATKLVHLIFSNDFLSGAHVDFWDLPTYGS